MGNDGVIEIRINIDILTIDNASILRQKFLNTDGYLEQVGDKHRSTYANSESGRLSLQENEPPKVVAAVFGMWGDSPTVIEEVGEENNTQQEQPEEGE